MKQADNEINIKNFTPYEPRKINFLEIREFNEYKLKIYSVLYGKDSINWNNFEGGFKIAFDNLPTPAVTEIRPGLGFIITHQGKTGDYTVLCWWDQENELPTKVFIREGERWRKAKKSESFCVWDLEIIWHERQAYISTLLNPKDSNKKSNYLSHIIE